MKNFKIKVKGVTYRVNLVDDIDGSSSIVGQTDFVNKVIKIRKSDITSIDTISHELFHAYFRECGLKDESVDEDLIWWLGYHFEDILKNVNFIVDKFKVVNEHIKDCV